jgi:uncharacterized membrane protein
MTISQARSKAAAPGASAQVRRAKGAYAWLWFSPFITLPTLGILWSITGGAVAALQPAGDYYQPGYQPLAVLPAVVAVLGSGLWHLLLLNWALDRRSEFARWHGRQALLLAGLRTAVALVVAIVSTLGSIGLLTLVGVLGLLALWLFGTLWGQSQAGAGECSLMRWAGHGASLPLHVTAQMHAEIDATEWADTLLRQGHRAAAGLAFRKILVSDATPEVKSYAAGRLVMPGQPGSLFSADILVAMLRFSDDPGRRRAALDGLEQAGLVEDL